jgi:hypothetical protein
MSSDDSRKLRAALLSKLRELRLQEDRVLADLETIDRPMQPLRHKPIPLVLPNCRRD